MSAFLKVVFTSILISSAIALLISLYSSANFVSTVFFVWAVIYFNANLLFWEDAMPGGFDNPDGPVPKELQGVGKLKFWALNLGGTAVLGSMGGYLLSIGL